MTRGDTEQRGPVAQLGVQGAFTKEIQSAVLESRVDVAVHSLKDLPTEPIDGLMLAAVPERENVADALVSSVATSLKSLPHAARVGTGSLRRQSQLKSLRPDLEVVGIRGNVDTRLRKLDEGQYGRGGSGGLLVCVVLAGVSGSSSFCSLRSCCLRRGRGHWELNAGRAMLRFENWLPNLIILLRVMP